jgi:hypothetical protein
MQVTHLVSACTNVQVNIDFDNWLSLATATSNTGSIYLDGNLINPSLWQKIGDYSVATQQISPGFHAVSTDTASSATFGGWLYGHSLDQYSTSAYGFPIGYKSKRSIFTNSLEAITSFETRYCCVLSRLRHRNNKTKIKETSTLLIHTTTLLLPVLVYSNPLRKQMNSKYTAYWNYL